MLEGVSPKYTLRFGGNVTPVLSDEPMSGLRQ